MSFATIVVKENSLSVINKMTEREIYALIKKKKPGEIAYGLTRVDINSGLKYELEPTAVLSKKKGVLDFYYGPITIYLGFTWVKVWIAKELKPSSCPYNAVLIHEKKHVALAYAVLGRYGNKLEESLNNAKIPTKSKPIKISHSEQSFDNNCKNYDKIIFSIFEKEFRNKEKLQEIYDEIERVWKKLDSDEEYERVKKSCKPNEWPY